MSKMDTLAKLFGSKHFVKILRLFLLNPDTPFDMEDVRKRTGVPADVVRREVSMLSGIGFARRRSFFKSVERKRGTKVSIKKKRTVGYQLNPNFEYLSGIRELVIGTHTISTKEVLHHLRSVGRLKYVVLTGAFLKRFESPLDLLIVGERFNRPRLESAIRRIETEFGKEVRYTILAPHDFIYRLSVRDRLVRDTLDYAHETVVDRLGVEA